MSAALNMIDRLIRYIDNEICGKSTILVFITGRAGSGKTTLGENFKTRNDFVHFDGDQYPHGNHPVKDSGQTIQKKDQQKRDKQMEQVYDNLAVKEGYYGLFQGKTPELSVWTPFYDLFINKINETKLEYPNMNIAISQSVYPRSVRDYIRNKCGNNAYFIILHPKIELSTARVVSRTHDLAAKVGKTAEEYLKEWGRSMEKLKNETAPMIQKGFEPMQDDEPNTYQIDFDESMTRQDVFEKAQQLLGLS